MGCGFSSPEAARGPASTRDQIIGRRTTHGSEPLDRSVFITATENGEWAPPAVCEFINARTLVGRLFSSSVWAEQTQPAVTTTSASTGRCPRRTAGQPKLGRGAGGGARLRLSSPYHSDESGTALPAPVSAPPASHLHGRFQRPAVDGTETRERERGEKAPSKSSKQAQPFTSKAIQEQHPYPFLFLFLLLQGSKPTHEYEHRELHPYHHSPPSLTVYVHVHSTRVYGVPSNR